MVTRNEKAYKNPRIPGAQSAPMRSGGMIQNAATARVTPREGAPSLPRTVSPVQVRQAGQLRRQAAIDMMKPKPQAPVDRAVPQQATVQPRAPIAPPSMPERRFEPLYAGAGDGGEPPPESPIMPAFIPATQDLNLAGFDAEAIAKALAEQKQAAAAKSWDEAIDQLVAAGLGEDAAVKWLEGTGQENPYGPGGTKSGAAKQQAAEAAGYSSPPPEDEEEYYSWYMKNYLASPSGLSEEQKKAEEMKILQHAQTAKQAQAEKMAQSGIYSGGLVGAGMGAIDVGAMGAISEMHLNARKLEIEENLAKGRMALQLKGAYLTDEQKTALLQWMMEEQDKRNVAAVQEDTMNMLEASGWTDEADQKWQELYDKHGYEKLAFIKSHFKKGANGLMEYTGPPGEVQAGGGPPASYTGTADDWKTLTYTQKYLWNEYDKGNMTWEELIKFL